MSDIRNRGREILAEVIGQDYFDAREASTNSFNADARHLSEEYCFGTIWNRPGLPRKIRSMLCLAMMTALNRPAELRAHVNGALNNGCTLDEIKEVLLQSIIYCGLPAGLEAIRVAEEVFQARELNYK